MKEYELPVNVQKNLSYSY